MYMGDGDMSVKDNTRYMTLRDALNFFDLDYNIVDNKILVYDIRNYFDDYDEFCSNAEEALDYGVRDSMVEDYFYGDEGCVPEELKDMNLDEVYDYLEENCIRNNYKEIIGAVSGRIPVVVEEWSTEEKK